MVRRPPIPTRTAPLFPNTTFFLSGGIGVAFGVGGGFDGGSAIAIQLVAQLASLLLTACYYGWFYASANQATPGKMAIGIKVVRSDGEGCGFWRGFGRYFGMMLSGLILGIRSEEHTSELQSLMRI